MSRLPQCIFAFFGVFRAGKACKAERAQTIRAPFGTLYTFSTFKKQPGPRAAKENGGDWRDIMRALRPVTQQVWQSLPLGESQRFLRHVRPYWEVHRHRIAPEIGDAIAQLVESGKITVHAGRLTNCAEFGDHVEVSWRDRQTRAERLVRVHRVINCTGPKADYRHMNDPLIKTLLARGLASR
jgi:uncharacterized NAD(P)/FAD-binding protein YdhS